MQVLQTQFKFISSWTQTVGKAGWNWDQGSQDQGPSLPGSSFPLFSACHALCLHSVDQILQMAGSMTLGHSRILFLQLVTKKEKELFLPVYIWGHTPKYTLIGLESLGHLADLSLWPVRGCDKNKRKQDLLLEVWQVRNIRQLKIVASSSQRERI